MCIRDSGCFLVIEQTQALCCGLSLIQNTLFDNSIHIGRGQRKTGIETSLNLGEVVTFHLGNGVDILLARYDYPSLTTSSKSSSPRSFLFVSSFNFLISAKLLPSLKSCTVFRNSMNQSENFTAPALYGFLSIFVLSISGFCFNVSAAFD